MADQPENKNASDPKQSLDLNELSGLDFGPNWAAGRGKSGGQKDYASYGDGKKGGKGGSRGGGKGGRGGYDSGRGSGPRSGGGSRDRRAGGARAPRGDGAGERGDPGSSREGRGDFGRRNSGPPPFEPTVKVDLYPQDEAFDALIKRLRSSARTYELFDIAQLLLEKPDRFVVVVAPLPSKGDAPSLLYYSVPGHLPFESEEAAVSFVVANHLDLFFDVEAIEIDPPKGNFQMVNRCTITGKLLGPPNYHRYQEFLRHHYATQINGMSFERFTSKIEGVKEPEQIEAWLDTMKKGARYTVKDSKTGEPESFESLEAARHFLLQYRKEQIVGSGESVRFAGRDIERMPPGAIRRSVEGYIEKQKVFPLESANNIRGRLRRHKFAVYKKGSKGVSFVCAVKRKFRDSKTVFTDSIRDLIEFIETHPEIPASKLPKAYIGIDTEKQKPEALKMTEAEVEAAAKAKAEAEAEAAAAATEATATEALSKPPVGATSEASVETSAEKPADAEAAESDAAVAKDESNSSTETSEAVSEKDEGGLSAPSEPTPEPKSAIADDAKASTEARPKVKLTEAESKKLRQLMGDLRWLITEGYVTEYGDGRLFAPPPMPEAKPKSSESTKAKASAKPVEAAEQEEAVVDKVTEYAEPAKKVDLPEVTERPETPVDAETTEAGASEEKPEETPREGDDPA